MFILLVAAEIYGIKHNIEIGFPERPSLADFVGHCEATFRSEVARVRPSSAPLHRFVIDSVKIFDDTLNRWVDLSSAHQLVEWSQLYLFQPCVDPANPNEESQAVLQPPVRIRSPLDVGKGKDKFFFLFHDMDFNGNGHLNRDEIQRIFNVMGAFELSEKSIDAMFQQFDTNRDGVLSYAEFSRWMQAMPDIGELLLKKSLEYWQSARQRRPDIRDSSEISAQERAAIEQYLERCKASAGLSASRVRSIKEMEDERLLLEREEELRRARDSFRSAYGRELGVPPTTAIYAANAVDSKKLLSVAAATIDGNGNSSGRKQQQQRASTPNNNSSKVRTAFGTTVGGGSGNTTPRKRYVSRAQRAQEAAAAAAQQQQQQSGTSAIAASSPSPAVVGPSASPKPSTPQPDQQQK